MIRGAAAILVLLAAVAQAEECRVPGTPAQWIAAYCTQRVETNQYESGDPLTAKQQEQAIQRCLAREVKNPEVEKQKMSECEQKIYRKKQICALLSPDLDRQRECSQDDTFVPLIVQQTRENR